MLLSSLTETHTYKHQAKTEFRFDDGIFCVHITYAYANVDVDITIVNIGIIKIIYIEIYATAKYGILIFLLSRSCLVKRFSPLMYLTSLCSTSNKIDRGFSV